MNTKVVSISQIKPNPANPRLIKDDKFKKLVKSITDFPQMLQLRPIVVNSDMTVLGGNMRLKACQSAGLTDVPILIADNLSEEQQKEFIIKDNVGFGEWDWDIIANEWEQDKIEEWGLELPVFFGGNETATDDNFDQPLPANPLTITGDLYELNGHRFLCGDSADEGCVLKVFDGKKPMMVFTDPPYGVSIGAKNRMLNSFQKAGRNLIDIKDDAASPEDLKAILLPAFVNLAKHTSDEATIFMTAPQGGELGMMMMMMKDAGIPIRHVLIWVKNAPTFSMGRLDYEYQHEPILLTWKKKHHYYGQGEHRTSTWKVDKPRSSKEHPTMKPVELVANALLNNSKKGDIVTDIYLGSGTTLIAADQLGRTCYGLEIMPNYCDVIVSRFVKNKKDKGEDFIVKKNGVILTDEEMSLYLEPNGSNK